MHYFSTIVEFNLFNSITSLFVNDSFSVIFLESSWGYFFKSYGKNVLILGGIALVVGALSSLIDLIGEGGKFLMNNIKNKINK